MRANVGICCEAVVRLGIEDSGRVVADVAWLSIED